MTSISPRLIAFTAKLNTEPLNTKGNRHE